MIQSSLSSSSILLFFIVVLSLYWLTSSTPLVNAKCPNLPSCKTHRAGFKPRFNGCGPRHSEIMRLLGSILFDSFTPCCNEHDKCYETCGNSRETCDQIMYKCMVNTCNKLYSSSFAKRSWCKLKAEGIKMGLKPDSDVTCTAFASAQQRACDCSEDDEGEDEE
ncbi:hypothetical protein C9374_001533 [Naegleria lovaniensis]|uniref:Phospholipase A2 n=1 Tax=Naegleria lovaniensis TaxID=51637 RepID=A0AA88GWH7_NAELO|nr:uncharacterized protein C9374_001533 [Naegleria lovaniensis]KAG2387201.1 hypothetical protein C9374_001533 [Naegleria lovaniensis]